MPMTHDTEALLMFAARREHVEQVIAPALARGDWVLCDRFTDATYAYQGGGHGVPRERIAELERFVHGDCQPDLTILFDVPIAVSRERLRARGGQGRDARQVRARGATRSSSACATPTSSAPRAEPRRFRVVDSSRPLAEVRAELAQLLAALVTMAGDDAVATRPPLARAAAVAGATPRARRSRARATWPHALLLDGPRGIGKRTLALNLARALLCETPRPGRLRVRRAARAAVTSPRASIRTCSWSSRSTWTRTARSRRWTPIPVDRIRALIEWVQLTSHRGGAKVAVDRPGGGDERSRPRTRC